MAKKLIFICGPNGVGKSSTGRELINNIKNSAFVDSDLCALRNPFIITEGIDIGQQFMLFMLTKYLESSLYETIIWAYGFHGHRKSSFNGRNDFEKMTSRKYEYIKGINGHSEIALYVDTFEEVDEEYAKAISKGAISVLEPTTESWGQRTCYIADPEGNLIEIGSFNKPFGR